MSNWQASKLQICLTRRREKIIRAAKHRRRGRRQENYEDAMLVFDAIKVVIAR